ncbi:potassium channel family protein [Eubacterium oxidoreducens]|uniref:Voltage-gated potassium channel n=1 Tax=Eubacterium oxidoreducens TaxID=1732 RepID=A0A1G6BNN1_EUBOX|nr:potassium channel family protein [Eubacterium oxidoreducens]SDB22165.1 voltage-gated potassium channel [Eubacterium oxidoreducens]
MKRRKKIIRQVLKNTGVVKIFVVFLIVFFLLAFVLYLLEADMDTYGDSLWFCFSVVTTIGLGDFVAQTAIGRVLTVVLSAYSIVIIALITAVITNYYIEAIRLRRNESIAEFVDDLQHLDQLSQEELREISKKVSEWDRKRK